MSIASSEWVFLFNISHPCRNQVARHDLTRNPGSGQKSIIPSTAINLPHPPVTGENGIHHRRLVSPYYEARHTTIHTLQRKRNIPDRSRGSVVSGKSPHDLARAILKVDAAWESLSSDSILQCVFQDLHFAIFIIFFIPHTYGGHTESSYCMEHACSVEHCQVESGGSHWRVET